MSEVNHGELQLAVTAPAVGVVVVRVTGEVDRLTAGEFADVLTRQLTEHPDHVVVDLEGVRFLGSAGLSVLIRAGVSAELTGTTLCLTGAVGRAVHRPLLVSGLLDVFDAYPTVDLALHVLSSRSTARLGARSAPL